MHGSEPTTTLFSAPTKIYIVSESIESGQTEFPLNIVEYKDRMFIALVLKNKQYVALDAKKVAHP